MHEQEVNAHGAISSSIANFISLNFIFDETAVIDQDESLTSSGVLDSTGVVELVTFLESEFGIAVEDDEISPQNLDSIARMAAFVLAKNQPASPLVARGDNACH